MVLVAIILSLVVVGTYLRLYSPDYGWSKFIDFGSTFAEHTLPKLKRISHYIAPDSQGNDGEFYAQMAIDPSLQNPAFDQALDNPAYRARRIGLPVFAYCLGWGKARWVIQAYAASNLIFWFVLMFVLTKLFKPYTYKQILGFTAALIGFGVMTSLEKSMVDLPAAALLFVGLWLAKSPLRWAGYSAAILTRETSVVAALGFVEWHRPFTLAAWRRNLAWLAAAVLPFGAWLLYIGHRFHGLSGTAGSGNFAFPLSAMLARLGSEIEYFTITGVDGAAKTAGPFGWWYLDEAMHEGLAVIALFSQGLYLVLRRDYDSAVWRTGIAYVALGCILGPGVWGWTGAAARVLLPMTVCFYLMVAKERDRWFWPFFVLGSLSIPFSLHHFWVLE